MRFGYQAAKGRLVFHPLAWQALARSHCNPCTCEVRQIGHYVEHVRDGERGRHGRYSSIRGVVDRSLSECGTQACPVVFWQNDFRFLLEQLLLEPVSQANLAGEPVRIGH